MSHFGSASDIRRTTAIRGNAVACGDYAGLFSQTHSRRIPLSVPLYRAGLGISERLASAGALSPCLADPPPAIRLIP